MNKLFALLIVLFSTTSVFSASSLKQLSKLPLKTILDKLAKNVPENNLLQQIFVQKNHTGTVVEATQLSQEKQQDIIINALIQAETRKASPRKLFKIEKALVTFFKKADKANQSYPEAFDQARRNMNFHGRHNYTFSHREGNLKKQFT
jgi:hypothetical protein